MDSTPKECIPGPGLRVLGYNPFGILPFGTMSWSGLVYSGKMYSGKRHSVLFSSLLLCDWGLTHLVVLFLSLGPGHSQSMLFLWGSIAKVVWWSLELYVIELHSRIYNVRINHTTNLIWLSFLSLSEHVATAFFVSCIRGWVTCQHFARIQVCALIIATAWKNPGVWWVSNHIPLKRRILWAS